MNTTAQPARALNRSAVGLGASLFRPSGAGMSVCQENGPCSITALLPSARAITLGVLRPWGIRHEKISASSQPEALKGPLAKFDGIGHARQ